MVIQLSNKVGGSQVQQQEVKVQDVKLRCFLSAHDLVQISAVSQTHCSACCGFAFDDVATMEEEEENYENQDGDSNAHGNAYDEDAQRYEEWLQECEELDAQHMFADDYEGGFYDEEAQRYEESVAQYVQAHNQDEHDCGDDEFDAAEQLLREHIILDDV